MKTVLKRAITLLLLLAIVFTYSTVSYAEQSTVAFADVSQDAWYYSEVVSAYNAGIMVGTSKELFEPDSAVTREMFITALLRVFDIDPAKIFDEYYEGRRTNFFADTEVGSWYYDSVCWGAMENVSIIAGIGVNERGSKIFGVGSPITRQDMATFILRILRLYHITLPETTDSGKEFTDEISDYAKEAVDILRKSGIVYGTDDGIFSAKKTATRAEAAAILLRISESLKTATAEFQFAQDTVRGYSYRDSADQSNALNSCTEKQTVSDFIEALNSLRLLSVSRMDISEFQSLCSEYYVFNVEYANPDYLRSFTVIIEKSAEPTYIYKNGYCYRVGDGQLKLIEDQFVK